MSQSFLTTALASVLPKQEDSLFAPQAQQDFQIAYTAARHLIDGLEWKWVAVTWLSIPNHRPRPFLYALPPKTLKTPSDENLPLPVLDDDVDITKEAKEAQDSLPRPEWIFPCYASEKTTLALWSAIFHALPKDPLPLLAKLETELPETCEPFTHFVQLLPAGSEGRIEIPSQISVSPIPQLIAASASAEGGFSFAVVREGFLNRSAGAKTKTKE